MADLFAPAALLDKPLPLRRAAYSDRTAWLMAEMARLAYLRFEDRHAFEAVAPAKVESCGPLERFAHERVAAAGAAGAPVDGEDLLREALALAGFELVATFNAQSTQAFLATRPADRLAVLAFRGTEKLWEDIRTDLKADLEPVEGIEGRCHGGFWAAWRAVAGKVTRAVDGLLAGDGGWSLHVCGHSLGGALAVIATKQLQRDALTACYTYGGPRVGDALFGRSIKAPIYRQVNNADIVTRIPPSGWCMKILAGALRLLGAVFSLANGAADWLSANTGYRHHGQSRYLSACKAEDCSDVELVVDPGFWGRLLRQYTNGFKVSDRVADHSIDAYCAKLGAYAVKRTG